MNRISIGILTIRRILKWRRMKEIGRLGIMAEPIFPIHAIDAERKLLFFGILMNRRKHAIATTAERGCLIMMMIILR